ncbi:MAG: ATPase, T2SS/T4P/T4SS family [Candidatus Omnitrophota bacterium]
MDEQLLELEIKLLDELMGKINLLQEKEEREKIAHEGLDKLCGRLEKDLLLEKVQTLKSKEERGQFLEQFFSYGIIDELFRDDGTEDIIINSLNFIQVHHSKNGLVKTDRRFSSQKELDLFIKKLLVFSGRDSLKKINNLELPQIEGRVNITYSPFGPQITITRTKTHPLSIVSLIANNSVSVEMAALIWLYVEGLSVKPANIIIAGGPGVGKTTLLNALFSFISEKERVVVIEDTLELNTQMEDNYSRLESDDDISLLELVKDSLRMRPDRIVIGEVRGEEARDLMTAINTGKYCLGSLHAGSAREAIIRLNNEPMRVPHILINLIDAFIVMKKFQNKDSVFRVASEITETAGMEQNMILLSPVYAYNYEQRNFINVAPSSIYCERLSKTSGFSLKEIMRELARRALVLKALKDNNIFELRQVSGFCRRYCTEPDKVISQLKIKV